MQKIKMTPKPLIIALTVFVLSVAFAVTVGLCLRGCDSGIETPEKTYSTKDYKYMSDVSAVEGILNTTDEKYLLLVNKEHMLGESYIPDALESVDPDGTEGVIYTLYGKEVELEAATAAAARALIDEMRALGYSNIFITSGYRSYARQKSLFDNYVYDEWLKENAHKFGFVLRYHDGKQDITGYAYESWHYRFVGIDAATKIYNSGLTLEEWLGK